MSAKRLDQGGRIDRSKPLNFTWDGMAMQGYQGDTLASALLANNEQILARSFKYHRPRGIMSAGVEESGALVTIGSGNRQDPNVKATMQELYSDLEAFGQNAWPNVRKDVGAINGLFGRFFSAGFYYKTFMGLPPFEWGKGTGLWMQYEKIIRKAAGMGTASREPDPDVYDHAHAFCDVLVVGGGAAGMAAAATAAQAGLDVILVEQDHELGGDLLSQSGAAAETQRSELLSTLEASGAKIMNRTTAFGLYDYGAAGLLERVTDHLPVNALSTHTPRQRFWTVRARQTILATGAIERHMAFGNNDKPGIMTAAAGRSYLNRYGVLPGQNVVVATNNDSAYQVAADLKQSGADVTLLDARHNISGSVEGLVSGIETKMNCVPMQAKGNNALQGLQMASGTPGNWSAGDNVMADLLLVSAGWSPVVN
ncbi:MAG: 2Fe-2S iron-sulfur cluster-binding protein, partial [Thiolinea sp.]